MVQCLYRDLLLVLVILIAPVYTWFAYEQIPYFTLLLIISALMNAYRNWLFIIVQRRVELKYKQVAYALNFAREAFSSQFVPNRCKRTLTVIDDTFKAIL